MMAVGLPAAELVELHPLGTGYGTGSLVERLVRARGEGPLLSAPL